MTVEEFIEAPVDLHQRLLTVQPAKGV